MRSALIATLAALLAACAPLVPATTPPQLSATPGTFIAADGQSVMTENWRVYHPGGWRIVKASIAGAPLHLVFVSPDDALWISISEELPLEDGDPEGNQTRFEEVLIVNNLTLYLRAASPAERAEELAAIIATQVRILPR